jgi:hypothetical protein
VATVSNPNDIDDIRRRMAQIRNDLHQDVQEVVAGAEAVADWRRYLRMYPWATVGVAAAVGYLIVPKRRRSIPRDVVRKSDLADMREVIEQGRDAMPEAPAPAVEKKRRKSLVAAAVAMVAPMVWRAAQNYALAYVEQWIAQQQQHLMPEEGPAPPSPPRASSPSASQRPSRGQAGWPGSPRDFNP